MEKAKIQPLATPKPLNRFSPKLICVIRFWTAPGMQNVVTDIYQNLHAWLRPVAIGSSVSAPEIRDFAVPLGWLVFCSFLGFTAYTLERIFTQNTAKDVVPGKEVSFGVTKTILIFRPLNFRKTATLGPILTGPLFSAENCFNIYYP